MRFSLGQVFLFFLVFLFVSCGPDPKELSIKSEQALIAEKPELAFELALEAYEASLPSESFPLGRKKFTAFKVSADGKKVLGVYPISPDKPKSRLRVWDENYKRIVNFEISKVPRYIQISANGSFVAMVYKKPGNKEECVVTALRLSDREYYSQGVLIPCSCRPAIDNRGSVYFWFNGRVYAYNFTDKKEVVWKKTPDRPYSRIPASASFFFSSADIPFFTFGAAGAYKMYNLESDLNMLTTKGALYRIYFRHDSDEPGIIIGGAGEHQVVFFDPVKKRKITWRVQSGVWQDAAFHSNELYYYMENKEIYRVRKEKHTDFEKEKLKKTEKKSSKRSAKKSKEKMKEALLPIWAQEIFADHKGNLVFITPTGSIMIWPVDFILPEEAKEYYQKAASLDPNREESE